MAAVERLLRRPTAYLNPCRNLCVAYPCPVERLFSAVGSRDSQNVANRPLPQTTPVR